MLAKSSASLSFTSPVPSILDLVYKPAELKGFTEGARCLLANLVMEITVAYVALSMRAWKTIPIRRGSVVVAWDDIREEERGHIAAAGFTRCG